MLHYYSLLVDLTVFSNWVSAYILVCGQMVWDVALFILVIVFLIVAFASGVSILKHDLKDFAGIPSASKTLTEMILTMVDGEQFKPYQDERMVATVLFIFLIVTVTFLLSLLVAQLTTAYSAVFELMVGYARLGRIRLMVVRKCEPDNAQNCWPTC